MYHKIYSLGEIIKCPRCGEINNWHFVVYYGDTCHECDYDIRTHVNNKGYFINRRKRFEELLNELYELEPIEEEHKIKFACLDTSLRVNLESVNLTLERIENFDLRGLY